MSEEPNMINATFDSGRSLKKFFFRCFFLVTRQIFKILIAMEFNMKQYCYH